MFKHVDDRALEADIMGMVERPICRDGLREDESRAMALLEDPIEFSQNIARVLWGTSNLQGVLMGDMPAVTERHLYALQEMVREAIARRDWAAVDKIHVTLEEETTATTADAREYGVAFGAVLEQLRTGLLEIARLRHAGATRHDRRVAAEINELRGLITLRETVQAKHEAHAAD